MVEAAGSSRARLYRHLLGNSWDRLDESLRRFHSEQHTCRATGVFRVAHGDNWLARLLVRLARLPAAGEAIEVHLVVACRDQGEEWRRAFAGRPLVSYQWPRPDGLLGEQMGLLEIGFRLEVKDGMLFYQSRKTALRLGPVRIAMPHWFAPSVSAREKSLGDGRIEVSVEVSAPLLGRLLTYEGTLMPDEAQG